MLINGFTLNKVGKIKRLSLSANPRTGVMVVVVALHLAMAGYLARQSLQAPIFAATPERNQIQLVFLPLKALAPITVVNPAILPKTQKTPEKKRPKVRLPPPSPVVATPQPQQNVGLLEGATKELPPSSPAAVQTEPAIGATARTLFPDAALLKSIAKEIESDTSKSHGNVAATLSPMAKLAKGIAAAARPRQTTVVDIRQGDGKVISKVTGPNGTWCVMSGTTPSALARGERPRLIAVNCPSE